MQGTRLFCEQIISVHLISLKILNRPFRHIWYRSGVPIVVIGNLPIEAIRLFLVIPNILTKTLLLKTNPTERAVNY